ncbi:hypothetical protein BG53_07705 [Paenibacillus darwinianus]|uniref:DUF2304 domain-containing protein n=1 Tax=Paenibacillus darwinianus TaxID=1380763 RepID=A0A9W5RZD8_9BACL|nr:DUF2304 domain-containing protein [Paenibacillus darwinianus]EXX85369.1 hypothetical protein BG52_08655 [Paenibacillus darwinianus]EXX85724.1 hypothetical protein CH50_08935 [Paenibacillus darwinianus]EXX85751.1 hypothetical protein BG53_07705 [Paenibacillus darwinianus]
MRDPVLLNGFVLTVGLLFSGYVVSLLVRKKINEKNTLVWLGSAIIILILSVNPEILDTMARWTGVAYPPTLLFLLSLLVLLLLSLYQSIQISALHDKIKELSQYIALRDAENQTDLEERSRHSKGA